jgi:DNA/RNA endonuclease YhcR with UshA esterase domain
MKRIFFLAILISMAKFSSAQIVSCDSAKYYGDRIISVKGIVMSTYMTQGEKKEVVLNFGKPYPDQSFQVIIFEKDLSKFPEDPREALQDKNITVRGKVRIVKGKPSIQINSPNQITIN